MSAAQCAKLQAEAVGFLNAPDAKAEGKPKKRVTKSSKRASSNFKMIATPVTVKLSRAKGTPASKKPESSPKKGKKSSKRVRLS
jgi:hypothetical protein